MLRRKLEDQLSATLLQWNPEDFPFREYAYAVLCMAAGGKYLTTVSQGDAEGNFAFGFISNGKLTESCVDVASLRINERSVVDRAVPQKADGTSKVPEFFSGLATGSHLEGTTPGSAPETTIYWLSGALVVLVSRLYEVDALDYGIQKIMRYYDEESLQGGLNAILCSIEHVALVKISPNGKIQHTGVLPLYDIANHLTLDVRQRYSASFLDKMEHDEKFIKRQKKKTRQNLDRES